MRFETLAVGIAHGVAHIELNRPEKANAIDALMWKELRAAFDWLSSNSARVGVLSGRGAHFTAGIDLTLLAGISAEAGAVSGSQRERRLKEFIVDLQQTVSAAESCKKPILAAIHGACIGGGVDLITACDMRYATSDARFSVKEVDLAIVADLGTLQRLPKLIGEGPARELAYTGRVFEGTEARDLGLANRVFPDKDSMMKGVFEVAASIASKSPMTIRGIKDTLNFSRDHSVAEGLAYVADKNAASLLSKDLAEAMRAAKEGRPPSFED